VFRFGIGDLFAKELVKKRFLSGHLYFQFRLALGQTNNLLIIE
jgi:hypothetical protein